MAEHALGRSAGASTGSSASMFWRNPSAAFFNFLLPLLFLAAGGAILSGNQHDLDKLRAVDRRR